MKKKLEELGKWYLYIINEGSSGHLKIGHGKSPKSRLSQLQTGNPRPLFIVYTKSYDSKKDAYRIEKCLHTRLRHYSLKGEWFEYRDFYIKMIESIQKDGALRYLADTAKNGSNV